MNGTRIIKLDQPLTVKAMNFQDVYEEFSMASGKRQQKKAERAQAKAQAKIQKIEAKKQVKAAKQERRKAKKVGRQEVRQATKEARVAKRMGAQQARQMKKTSATQARQERRTMRKTAQVERKAIGQPEDAMQEQEMDENLNAPVTETPVAETEEGAEETATTSEGEATPEEYTEETETVEETTEESPEEEPEETADEEEETESFVGADGYYDFFTGEGLKNNTFDNESLGSVEDIYALQPDDFYTYSNGTPDSNFDGNGGERFRINPKVLNAAMKSEWNKEKVSRLKINLDAIENAMAGVDGEQARLLGIKKAKTQEAIELHKARASSFDAMLSNYAGFDGLTIIAPNENFDDGTYDDTTVIGDDDIMSYADGRKRKKVSAKKTKKAKKVAMVAKKKKISRKELGRRRAETRAAVREARKSRLRSKGLVKKSKADSFIKKLKATRSKSMAGVPVTEIEQGLNPEITKNRIVIPPRGLTDNELRYNADGTGMIAIDDASDYDAPTGIMYEQSSGADGMKGNTTGILIGVAVAGLAIWAVKKYKLI